MRTCRHCRAPVALRPDQVWVHKGTRSRHCNEGPIPRPQALPAVEAPPPSGGTFGGGLHAAFF